MVDCIDCKQAPGFTLVLFHDLDFPPTPCKMGDESIYRGYFLSL